MKNKILYALILLLILNLTGCQNAKNAKIEIVEFEAIMHDVDGNMIVPKNHAAFAVHGKDGEIILDAVFVKYKDRMSVADLSKAICRELEIPISFSGIGPMAYVQGIANLFEFDNGPESGWVYCVNGEFQGVSSGDYTVRECDYVEWFYTLDLGKDVGGYKLY